MTSDRLKVLLTASTFPRWAGDTEPEFILQLARAMSQTHDITVLVPHCAGAAPEEWIDGLHVVRFRYAPQVWENLAYQGGMMNKLKARPLRWLLVPLFLLGQCFAIRSLQRQYNFDLLHVHWIIPQGLVALLARWLRFYRGPMLLTSHGGDLFSLSSPLFSRIKRLVLRQADRVNVVSNAMVESCVELGVERERIAVRSMGVDLDERFVNTRPFAEREGFIFVGRLVEKKGVEVLIDAFARLLQEHPQQRLRIVGDGPLAAALKRKVADLGITSQVDFTGAVANQEVPALLNTARVAVVPSVVAADGDQEGLGLVAVEAMGCGCTVVASDLPALRDVIDDMDSGLMVPPADQNALAAVLSKLINDPTLAERIAANGRGKARGRFDWSSVAKDYHRLYGELISDQL